MEEDEIVVGDLNFVFVVFGDLGRNEEEADDNYIEFEWEWTCFEIEGKKSFELKKREHWER